MGLAEKRVAASLEQESFPEWKKAVLSVVKEDLKFEVKWEDLVKDGYTEHYPATVEYNFFAPLIAALKEICSDKMGKDALKSTIKKIKITSNRSWSSLEVKVDGDTLHLDGDPSYSRYKDDCASYRKTIQEALEKAL